MSAAPRLLNLNLFIYPGGHHEAAWRYHGSAPDRGARGHPVTTGTPEQIADRIEQSGT